MLFRSRSERLPDGLGITLSVGEQSRADYARLREAGAHRYLLRMETFSPALFARLHPPSQTFAARLECLHALRDTGFMVGTGVMIGIPGQTLADLAHDLCMFAALDVDMIGMGPYIPHARSAMPDDWPVPPVATRLDWTLRMIAVARLLLRDANIAATTALQTLDPQGRERALRCGANVMMPQTTPPGVRRHYQLYDGKPCLDDQPEACAACLVQRIAGAKITLVPILRAGLGMLPGVLALIPAAKVSVVGLQRDDRRA